LIRLSKLAPISSAMLALCLLAGGPARAGAGSPLVTVPAGTPGDTLVVFYSGDGGWATVDRGVTADLAAHGLPVVGVDSLRYFRGQSPERAAADLVGLIGAYGRAWDRRRVVLAGYSFGADALPRIAARLPPAVRARVRLVALISPGVRGSLKVRLTDWLDIPSPDAAALAPALAALKPLPILCIYGSAERHAGCPRFGGAVSRSVRLNGGHHLGRNYVLVGDTVVSALDARRGA
jgi:type IV secretory pathway VirJ component